MAALLIGGAVLLNDKIKERKKKKRDAKQDAYEKRYKELEADHRGMSRDNSNTVTEKQPGEQSTGSAQISFDPQRPQIRRASHESERSQDGKGDGPSDWVNGARDEKG